MTIWPESLAPWRNAAAEFATTRLHPFACGGESHNSPEMAGILRELADLGFHQLCAPEALDGLNQEVSTLAAVLESMAQTDCTTASMVYGTAAAWLAVTAAGAELPDTTAAESWLAWPAFHGVVEHSWPGLTKNRLTGQAPMVLGATHAPFAVIPARPLGSDKVTLALVNLSHKSVHVSGALRTHGLSAAGISDLSFKSARCVTLGEMTTEQYLAFEDTLTIAVAALYTGLMGGSLETAKTYATQRRQGGGPISGWGEVRRMLSEATRQYQSSVALLSAMLTAEAPGANCQHHLITISEAACALTSTGIQVLGGNGYTRDYGQEKRMRDARQLRAMPGGIIYRKSRLASNLYHPSEGVLS